MTQRDKEKIELLDTLFEEIEAIGWPCRLVELPRQFAKLQRDYGLLEKQNELRARRITQLEDLLKKHGINWRKELPIE